MNRTVFLGLLLIVGGCTTTGSNGDHTGSVSTAQQNTSHSKANKMEITPKAAAQGTPTHVVVQDTQYYSSGPQQARPPDGTLKAGTQVILEQETGSYVVVQTVDGIMGYIPISAIKPIE